MTEIESLLAGLRTYLPVVPVDRFDFGSKRVGLVVVDEVNGFATPGAGALAPPAPDARVDAMVWETDSLARRFVEEKRPILAFLDTHVPGKPEPPYPAHCEIGTGEENLIPALAWLESSGTATLVRKDCINGFVGGINLETGRNAVVDWIVGNRLQAVVVVGICTDICVMDFVLTLLSARNHGMLADLADIVVLESACATYNLSPEAASAMRLPRTAIHPQAATHHAGLYMMASRGAVIAGSVG